MDKIMAQPFKFPAYRQLQVSYDPETESLWYYLNPKPRPTFNSELLSDIRDFQNRASEYAIKGAPGAGVRYLILASAVRNIFNLGGDLVLFQKLIQAQDRNGLLSYARTCVDAVYQNAVNLGVPGLTTISLVQGTALGGGFEAALSGQILVAERSAQMGFPEILFNLFPGMGAYSLLTRRVNPSQAERLLHSGAQTSAAELHASGIVDELAPDGGGVAAVRQFIKRHSRARNGHLAIQRLRRHTNPLSYEELMDITSMWVDAALQITARDLRTMARLAGVQYRLPEGGRLTLVDESAGSNMPQSRQEPVTVPASETGITLAS